MTAKSEVRTVAVEIVNGQATTTSVDVALHFGKRHRDVLRALRQLDCSAEFNERNFAPVEYRDEKGERRPMYRLTRDGFTFLAMGFTGPEAARWKEAYIEAFNRLEQVLRKGLLPAPVPPTEVTLPASEYMALLKDKIRLLELEKTSQSRRRLYSAEEKARVKALLQAGQRPVQIAAVVGRTVDSVANLARTLRKEASNG